MRPQTGQSPAVWILSYNPDGGPGRLFSPKHGVVHADRRVAERQLWSLVTELSGADWEVRSSRGDKVVMELPPNGWAMIESFEVTTADPQMLLPIVGSDEEKLVVMVTGHDPAPHRWIDVTVTPPFTPAVGDAVVLRKPGSEDSVGWCVIDVFADGARVAIRRGESVKHLERGDDGRWVYPRDVWASFPGTD